jgi:hypothetical protein
MPNCRHVITPEITHTICAYIRQGGFPDIAAEAAGIPIEVFQKWLAKGQAKKAREPYRSFASEVRQAIAQCRIMAEMEVRKKDPRFWLLKGPGRETPDRRGWARETTPLVVQDNRTINLLASPQWNSLWATILQALADFPDARIALAQALKETQSAPAITHVVDSAPSQKCSPPVG